jgi:hypothetical protein
MNTKIKKLIIVISITTALTFTATIPGFKNEVRAGSGGAFVGGMLAGHVIGGAVRRSKERTAAMNEMAYGQPRSSTTYVQQQPATTQSAPAPAAQPSAKQKLNELDNLAANGYITPAEYKARRQAILDSL